MFASPSFVVVAGIPHRECSLLAHWIISACPTTHDQACSFPAAHSSRVTEIFKNSLYRHSSWMPTYSIECSQFTRACDNLRHYCFILLSINFDFYVLPEHTNKRKKLTKCFGIEWCLMQISVCAAHIRWHWIPRSSLQLVYVSVVCGSWIHVFSVRSPSVERHSTANNCRS